MSQEKWTICQVFQKRAANHSTRCQPAPCSGWVGKDCSLPRRLPGLCLIFSLRLDLACPVFWILELWASGAPGAGDPLPRFGFSMVWFPASTSTPTIPLQIFRKLVSSDGLPFIISALSLYLFKIPLLVQGTLGREGPCGQSAPFNRMMCF